MGLCWAYYICHHSSDDNAVEFILYILLTNVVVKAVHTFYFHSKGKRKISNLKIISIDAEEAI